MDGGRWTMAASVALEHKWFKNDFQSNAAVNRRPSTV
jgi:hypothetical protein